MRTDAATSPIPGASVAISLTAFIIVYGFVFGAGAYYILKLVRKGPETQEEVYGTHGLERPPLVTDLSKAK